MISIKMNYSPGQLRDFYDLLCQRMSRAGPRCGISSAGVDFERQLLSIVVRPGHDEERLATLLADIPLDALSVEVCDEEPQYTLPIAVDDEMLEGP